MITLAFAVVAGLVSVIVAVIVGIVTIGGKMSDIGRGDDA